MLQILLKSGGENMNRVHYQVTQLVNEQMKNEVKNSLGKIAGVQMVNVDMGRSSIEVGYNESADEDTIRECIEGVGCRIQ
jgi:copper chaperone CopZ